MSGLAAAATSLLQLAMAPLLLPAPLLASHISLPLSELKLSRIVTTASCVSLLKHLTPDFLTSHLMSNLLSDTRVIGMVKPEMIGALPLPQQRPPTT